MKNHRNVFFVLKIVLNAKIVYLVKFVESDSKFCLIFMVLVILIETTNVYSVLETPKIK